MPTYEYRCPDGHEFESFVQKMSDAKSELPCPTCGIVAARRMSAGSGFLFKGSGFYITDYGKDGKKDQRDAAAKAKDAPAKEAAAVTAAAPAGSAPGSSAASTAPGSAPVAATAPAKPSAPPAPTPKPGPDK